MAGKIRRRLKKAFIPSDTFTGSWCLKDTGPCKKTFSVDLFGMDKIVRGIRERLQDISIAVITIPGLFSTDRLTSPDAIEKGYVTVFSDNLAAWAL